jgi:hypothetical protein
LRRHLGRASLAGSIVSWAVLVLALVGGGLDPPASLTPLLHAATITALGISVVSLGLAILAIVHGPQRVAAAFGLGFSLLFVLSFTGSGFGLVTLLR